MRREIADDRPAHVQRAISLCRCRPHRTAAVLVLSSGVLPVGDAVARETARVGAGLPVDIPSSWGEWIADVERPAEEYRGRYQLRAAPTTLARP